MESKPVESLDTREVQGVEVSVHNTYGDVFVIRKFRRSRGDYYFVRHPQSGAHERFPDLEQARRYMQAPQRA